MLPDDVAAWRGNADLLVNRRGTLGGPRPKWIAHYHIELISIPSNFAHYRSCAESGAGGFRKTPVETYREHDARERQPPELIVVVCGGAAQESRQDYDCPRAAIG